jgi:hypothetical protein
MEVVWIILIYFGPFFICILFFSFSFFWCQQVVKVCHQRKRMFVMCQFNAFILHHKFRFDFENQWVLHSFLKVYIMQRLVKRFAWKRNRVYIFAFVIFHVLCNYLI